MNEPTKMLLGRNEFDSENSLVLDFFVKSRVYQTFLLSYFSEIDTGVNM